ncbi:hypothetical protein Mal65_14170 [Crateriforma conspicua]|nr:hypothetical protein Mal65_14170 [Crateriforma conspicua]
MDQVRAIAGDSNLRDEIVRQANESSKHRTREFETQRIQLTRQLTRDHREIQALVLERDGHSSTSARIADLQQRIESAERKLTSVKRDLADAKKHCLSAEYISNTFAEFDRIWDVFNIREQAELLGLLVASVEFDQSDSTIEISFHRSGIGSLST